MNPRQQERLFPREYAPELIKIAKADLQTAKFLFTGFNTGEVRPENLFFTAQQAIEKSLKAVLCYCQIPVPLVHDLGILVAKLPNETNPQFGYEIDELSEFAGIRRYEEVRLILTEQEATDVLMLAEEILHWAEEIIYKK